MKRMATRDSPGTTSFNSCNRFDSSWAAREEDPVMFPPGRARSVTTPLPRLGLPSTQSAVSLAQWARGGIGAQTARLARRSFELHAELSAELGDPWGYRRLTTYG